MKKNLDPRVVEDFGREWQRFDQTGASDNELKEQFERYFSLFPWDRLPEGARGFDLGCGSGRWARFVAPRVGELACIDASPAALTVARRNLANAANCTFHVATVDDMPLADDTMDFCYSLGVLHHVPDTAAGIRSCVEKLRKGAPMLLYLYYALDNRPFWFRCIWRATDYVRRAIARAPGPAKRVACELIAATVYWPLARLARACEQLGLSVESFPLSAYRNMSFYTMRTDALDRFGTRLEQRFSRSDITIMMRQAGLTDIRFRDEPPYWCAVAIKA